MAKGEMPVRPISPEETANYGLKGDSYIAGMSRRSQRIAAVAVIIALSMVACVKLSGAVENKSVRYALMESGLATNATESSDEVVDSSYQPGQPGHGDEIGGWKKSWSVSEWAEWIIPGPLLTVVSTISIAYIYGPIW
eukprot:CAMPEP_0172170446 /NCGR_PEP_ID=MMETSP1050-20130122/11269_1 /TAXON_ID=233186 /ORGANISM="Cryptomonas curvata, Strain CCAP979/52" /LENGTH=137 /DNA_ID=CAMNT_0012841623 /DNA_START=8 /DNA_END=418 /DNA_ORIENTATION=+